jgi:hypothetical protein
MVFSIFLKINIGLIEATWRRVVEGYWLPSYDLSYGVAVTGNFLGVKRE